MSITEELLRIYFDIAYNPVYDFTTGRFHHYLELQHSCIAKLDYVVSDKVLCVGIGTGNEISHVLEMNRKVSIVGIDYSRAALRRAYRKTLKSGKKIEVMVMDAQHLEFCSAVFDKIICIHLMDFVEDHARVTNEIFRVLKNGGQFVITYPSLKEGPELGYNLVRDNIRHAINNGQNPIKAFLAVLGPMLATVVYLPLLLRPKPMNYCRDELEVMISKAVVADFVIDEDPVYQDFIVYGKKIREVE